MYVYCIVHTHIHKIISHTSHHISIHLCLSSICFWERVTAVVMLLLLLGGLGMMVCSCEYVSYVWLCAVFALIIIFWQNQMAWDYYVCVFCFIIKSSVSIYVYICHTHSNIEQKQLQYGAELLLVYTHIT